MDMIFKPSDPVAVKIDLERSVVKRAKKLEALSEYQSMRNSIDQNSVKPEIIDLYSVRSSSMPKIKANCKRNIC
jgi:hypothetical protein